MKMEEFSQEIQDNSKSKSEKIKYRKNSTLYFKSKFSAPPPGLFDTITPSYGLGVGIYFDLIQQFFAIFLIMFLVSIGCLYLNINGNGIYGEFKLELDVLSMANQPVFGKSEQMKESDKSDYELRMNIYYICDCIYSIIFFIYLIYARNVTYKKLAKLKDQSDSIKYFTVQVTGFPENVINAYDIKNHFENLEDHKFNVAECILQRNYQDTLKYQQEKLLVQQKLEIELNRSDLLQEKTEEETLYRDEKLQNLREQIIAIDDKIKNQINNCLSNEELTSSKAFVTFSHRKQRSYALTLYENWGGVQDPRFKYKSLYALQVTKAEDPSCIIWENQDVSLPDIYASKSLTIIIGIILSFLVLLTFLIFSKSYKDTWRIDEYTCLANLTMTKTDPRYEQCVCMSGSQLKADATVTCSDYSVSVPNTIFGLVMSILLFFFRVFMDVFISKERHQTKVQKNKGIFFSIFFWMSLNAILFMFFFHFTFDNRSVSLQEYFSYIIPPFKDSQKIMTILFPSDLDRNWIINVGYKFTLISLFNSLFPQMMVLAIFLSIEWFKEQKQEKKRIDFIIDRNPTLNLRKDHPEINKNSLFTLPDKYGQFAFTCFLGFIFAGPIPILLFITSLSLCFQIIFDRYMLMRYNSFDIIENQRLEVEGVKFGIYFLKWMPWCVVLHLLFSIYNFSSPAIFPNIQALNLLLTDDDVSNKFAQRLAKSIILSGLLALFLLVLLFTDIFKCNGCLKKKKKVDLQVVDEEKATNQDTYITCLNKIQDQGKLITYDISENEDYVEIIDLINQESEKNAMKKISDIDQNQIDIHANMIAESLNQIHLQNLKNNSVQTESKNNIFIKKKSRRGINDSTDQQQNLNQSINQSNIKNDQADLDNSLINPNNMSQIQSNEEEPIINKKGKNQQLSSSKISQNNLEKEQLQSNRINEEAGEQSPNNTNQNEQRVSQTKMTQLKASAVKLEEKKRKKKKKKFDDQQIQEIIKDYK